MMADDAMSMAGAGAPRGWNRPVRPLALLLVGAGVLLVWLVLMAAAVWYFYEHWEARLTLQHQPVRLRLPEGMLAMAEVSTPVKTRLDVKPLVQVPIRQVVSAQLSDHLQAQVQLKTVLPVDTQVTVDQVIPVRTTLNLMVALRAWLPAMPVTVPVTLDMPLHVTVPVKTDLPVNLDLLVSGNLPPSIQVPIDATFQARPRVKGAIEARMVSQTAFRLLSPTEPFDLRIEQARLSVPFNLTFLKQRAPQ